MFSTAAAAAAATTAESVNSKRGNWDRQFADCHFCCRFPISCFPFSFPQGLFRQVWAHTHKHWKTNTKTIRQLLFKACHSFPLWFAQLLFYYPSKKEKHNSDQIEHLEMRQQQQIVAVSGKRQREKEVTACKSPFLFFKGEMRLSWQKKKLLPEQDGSSVALQGANWAKLNQIEHCTGLTRLCTEARTQSRRSVSECKSSFCVLSMNMNFYLFFFLLFYRPVTPWSMGGCTLTHTGTFCNPQMQTFCPLSPCCCC